jgi:sugar phosphate isomerase/epimerase
MLEELEKHEQKLFAVYTPLNVDSDNPGYDPQLKELIPKLKGHSTIVWLVVNSKRYKPSSTDGDERAVALLREIADLAQASGVSISLYPHRNCYAERMQDILRLAKKTNRPNVGVTFSLCHFMAVDDVANLPRVLELAKPYLTMVTINGTSGYDPNNRAGWIQTLDQGEFDVSTVLAALRKLDYQGPIGIIAFGIRGDPRDILSRSIRAWRRLSAKAASGR